MHALETTTGLLELRNHAEILVAEFINEVCSMSASRLIPFSTALIFPLVEDIITIVLASSSEWLHFAVHPELML